VVFERCGCTQATEQSCIRNRSAIGATNSPLHIKREIARLGKMVRDLKLFGRMMSLQR
jgi:hypothetical protein